NEQVAGFLFVSHYCELPAILADVHASDFFRTRNHFFHCVQIAIPDSVSFVVAGKKSFRIGCEPDMSDLTDKSTEHLGRLSGRLEIVQLHEVAVRIGCVEVAAGNQPPAIRTYVHASDQSVCRLLYNRLAGPPACAVGPLNNLSFSTTGIYGPITG